jgi:hypothetical protein
VTPFALHRQAVATLVTAGPTEAGRMFRESLAALDGFLADPVAVAQVSARATLIPGWSDNAEALAREFVGKIGGWIAEWHFESFYEALVARRLPVARLHWQALQWGDTYPTLRAGVLLSVRRDMVCERLHLNTVELDARPTAPPAACRHADLVLSVDPANATARGLAVSGYSKYAHHIVDSGRHARTGERAPQGLTRPRERRQLRLATRMLNRHLTAGRSGTLDEEVVVQGFTALSDFYAVLGDADKALKMIRRARRLKPADRELARRLRAIRALPKAR